MRPEDPEPGEEMRYLRGDGEGNRVRGEERQVGRRCKPSGIGWWRLEQELGRSHLKSSVGESLGGEVSREVTPPNTSEAVEKLRSSFGQQCPPAISGMRSGQNVNVSEGFFSPSVHFVEKQESPTFSSQQIRKAVPVSSAERPEDRFVKASDLVNKVNQLSRQKRGGYFDISGLEFSENCPLCELECQCLGPSCLQKISISDIFRYKQSLQPKMIFCTGVSEVKVRSAPVTDRLPRLASKTYFGLEIVIRVWNFNKPGQPITPNEDIYGLSDLFFDTLLLPAQPNGDPVITEFLASYHCGGCGYQDQNLTHWIGMSHLKLPGLDVPRRPDPVPVGELLTALITTPFNVQCMMCGNQQAIGSYQVRRGLFTVVRLNRLNVGDWRNQVLTRLDDTRTQGIGDQYLGTLIGVVSHQGNPQGGHYIAYSRVNNQWHLNSDAAHVRQVGYHPFNPTNQNETVGLLVYKNN